MVLVPASSHTAPATPVIAAMKLSAQIVAWDGSAIPFDVVLLDADSLWDAVNHQFVAKAAGWYRVTTFGTSSSAGQVRAAAVANTGIYTLDAIVFGAGDNLHGIVGQHTAITDGVWYLPNVGGLTHLDAGDGIDIESANSTAGLVVPAGFCFSIERVVAT